MKEDFEEKFLGYDLVKDTYGQTCMSIYDIFIFSSTEINNNK